MDHPIYLPTPSHWEFGNGWTGSKGRASFSIRPEDGVLFAEVWTGPLCRDLCEAEQTAQFPLSTEGLAQLAAWLEEQSAARGETTA